MNDIFDSKRIISLVHFIGKHQFVTDLHAKFLCCGAGDHDLIFLIAGLLSRFAQNVTELRAKRN